MENKETSKLSIHDTFCIGVAVGMVITIIAVSCFILYNAEDETEHESNKKLEPTIKVSCIEEKGIKECDTTWVYKIKYN